MSEQATATRSGRYRILIILLVGLAALAAVAWHDLLSPYPVWERWLAPSPEFNDRYYSLQARVDADRAFSLSLEPEGLDFLIQPGEPLHDEMMVLFDRTFRTHRPIRRSKRDDLRARRCACVTQGGNVLFEAYFLGPLGVPRADGSLEFCETDGRLLPDMRIALGLMERTEEE